MTDTSSTQPAALRIIIVDDDPLVRAGLAMILGSDPGVQIIAQAADGAEAVATVAQDPPDVVLMDIRMPVLDGLAATEEILKLRQPPHIILLTTFDTDDMVLRGLRTGAAGFLLKDTPPAQLLTAIKNVAAGTPALSPQVAKTLIATATSSERSLDDQAKNTARAQITQLTERELQVAQAVERGLSNAEIAAELYLSIPTVKAHVGRIMAKLLVDNRVQLALLVHDAHL
ncbi:response regulator transcription factor [Glutamicibacter sp.]|uniref:response regulator transcription factor n=1 Tax=Glutamicibacter sp. TaxID=1931995 RepID=UPI0028BD57BA|nr:response regulator transcription factor [Glutamicibacter sp.]